MTTQLQGLALYWDTLLFTARMVAPIFLLVALGALLRRTRLLDEAFVHTGSRLVFLVCLPVLVFISISQTHIRQVLDLPLMALLAAAVLLTYLSCSLWARAKGLAQADRGAFVQGAFRSNFGIIGLAMAVNLFGEAGLGRAAVLLALGIPLFNVLSILALSGGGRRWGQTLATVCKNPLIIAVALALPFSVMEWRLPALALDVGQSLGRMTLPLALLTIGATLNFRELKSDSKLAGQASLVKLLWMPGLSSLVAWGLGFAGKDVALLFVMLGSPTAAAAFVMARAMGANAQLTANIILVSTLGSVLSLSGGIYLMRLSGLI
ncbi:AEC family transporter [Gallaecimonas kandeliae]|uniref:AEC family transporter n=1 Tax=Gallaecimonas kandeliae TaxID=3029055 RepID=UPI00264A2733|nr:AEC family transporter [Gallaecimonas kandeliae]WKE65562.1 AEC family transporter [Gallaecimonas kandeliae]